MRNNETGLFSQRAVQGHAFRGLCSHRKQLPGQRMHSGVHACTRPWPSAASAQAFSGLHEEGSASLPLARLRRLMPILARHLPVGEARQQLGIFVSELEAHGSASSVEYPDFFELVQLLASSTRPTSTMGQAVRGLRVMDSSIVTTLSPLQLRRVSRIAFRMSQAGHVGSSVNLLLRVLFVSASRVDIESLFNLLDRNKSHTLNLDEFRSLIHIVGEQVKRMHAWGGACMVGEQVKR